jgi:DNA-binding helix-hairpin-helix protein with protein kinase domain
MDQLSDELKEVVDARGARYRLGRLLGTGGQGSVHEVAGGRLAVKLFGDRSPSRREQLRRQLLQVKLLPLSELPVARPLEMLQPPVLGYVMELITGMMPLERLMVPPSSVDIAEWYLQGGGLRRRLRLLARLSELLARLHGLGLVYSDPSPRNTFVSEDADQTELWLIDTDNLHHEGGFGTPTFYTPGFGAPELVRGERPVSTLTDAHALAVLVFQTLSLVHPLVGDAVDEGEPELQERAFAGDAELPWVDHPTDTRNASSRGLPRELVLTKALQALCQTAFVEGLSSALERPLAARWAEALHQAADRTLLCGTCQGTFYLNLKQCPFCGTPRDAFVLLKVRRWEPTRTDGPKLAELPPVDYLALQSSSPQTLTARLTEGLTGPPAHAPQVELTLQERKLKVRCLEGTCIATASDGSQPTQLDGRPRTMPFDWLLHFGPLERPHRVAQFERFPEVRP